MNNHTHILKSRFSFLQRTFYNFFQFLDHFIGRKNTIKIFGKLRYKNFLSMVKVLEAKGEGTFFEVERRTDLTIKEFKEYYVKNGIPVIFDGLAKDWESVKNWSPQYFKDLHGTDEVPLIDSTDMTKGVEYMTLSELIDNIDKGNNKAYFRFYNLLVRHPEHVKDFDLEWLRKHSHSLKYFESFQVFIGGKNSYTGLHNSHIANLFIQVYGEKEWRLIPMSYLPFIDPPSTTNGIFRYAPARNEGVPFNVFEPNYEAYPYYKYIDGYKMTLKPGDVFYNPPFMWHTVKNPTDSIGVGFRWANAWHSFNSSRMYYILDLLAFRPNYFKSIRQVKKNANQQFIDQEKKMKKNKRRY